MNVDTQRKVARVKVEGPGTDKNANRKGDSMSRGMKNRMTVLELMEELEFIHLTDSDVNKFVGMLNKGESENVVLETMEKLNSERS